MDTLLSFMPDANNNQAKDKYSLRPRSMRRNTAVSSDPEEPPQKASVVQTKKQKQKHKAAPLSKYRRKTANARERNRMREINQAFETLRKVVPHMQIPPQVQGANEKLTKITTLRLAMKYIAALSSALNEPSAPLSDYSDLDCLLLESDGESLPLSDNSFLASPDFPDTSLSPVDFSDPSLPSLLHTDFTEHSLVESDDLSEFLLT